MNLKLNDKVKGLETSLQDEQLKAKQLQAAMEEIQFCNEELTVNKVDKDNKCESFHINFQFCGSRLKIQAEEMIEKRTIIGDGLAPGAQTGMILSCKQSLVISPIYYILNRAQEITGS